MSVGVDVFVAGCVLIVVDVLCAQSFVVVVISVLAVLLWFVPMNSKALGTPCPL